VKLRSDWISIVVVLCGAFSASCTSPGPLPPSRTTMVVPWKAIADTKRAQAIASTWAKHRDVKKVRQLILKAEADGVDLRQGDHKLCEVYAEMGDLKEAETTYRRYLGLDEGGPGLWLHGPYDYWLQYGFLCERMGKKEDARVAYSFIVASSNKADAEVNRADKSGLNDFPPMPTYQTNPELKALAELITAREIMGFDRKKAMKFLHAADAEPDTPHTRFCRARALYSADPIAAKKEFARAARISVAHMKEVALRWENLRTQGSSLSTQQRPEGADPFFPIQRP